MRELMLELLTYEPYEERLISGEEDYIRNILSGWYLQPKSMFHVLFSGFYRYVKNGDFKDIDWLRHWKSTYIQNQNYTYSSKGGRDYYPLLFKKICFYIIVRGNFTDKEFMAILNLHENLIRKWQISTKLRKYAETDTYSAIKSFRSGAKKPYIVSIVKKLYYEAGRQVRKSTIVKELPTFVDVFAGTASVSASMGASKGFPPPIVNDYDPVMVCFAWAFTHCQRELRKRIAGFHNDLMKQDFQSTPWSYSERSYEESIDPKSLLTSPKIWDDPKTQWSLMELQGYSKEEIEGGRILAQRYQELVTRTRSSYLDVKRVLDFCDRDNLRKKINFSESPKTMDKKLLEDVLDYAQAMYYYFSFAPSGKNGNVYHETTVDACSYFSYLSRLQVDLDNAKRKDKAVKAWTLSELQLKASLLTLESTGEFSKHLRHATFTSKDFRSLLQNGPSDRVYYLDSPYFLTVGYAVGFSDDDHIDMLDILRDADFKWIFSMQYNQSERDKCTTSSDEAVRKDQPHIIKNYGAYYRGFYAPFQEGADQRVYDIPKDAPMDDKRVLYVILFDFDEVKKKWPKMKTETREMLVVNFDCLPAIPLHNTVVVLPFDLFLQCADSGMAYRDIVQKAIDWRKDNIRNNYAGKCHV